MDENRRKIGSIKSFYFMGQIKKVFPFKNIRNNYSLLFVINSPKFQIIKKLNKYSKMRKVIFLMLILIVLETMGKNRNQIYKNMYLSDRE